MLPLMQYKMAYSRYRKNKPTSLIRKIVDLIRFGIETRIVTYKGVSYRNFSDQFCRVIKRTRFRDIEYNYVYPLDTHTVRCIPKGLESIASVTVDYGNLLLTNLKEKREEVEGLEDLEYKSALLTTLNSIEHLIDRICGAIAKERSKRALLIAEYIDTVKIKPCTHFDEAIQRILFFNALFWQNGHQQNGIGRLDLILYPYYQKDVKDGILTREDAKKMLSDMLTVLGKDMLYKSASLTGDTGQIIILGGVDAKGKTVENDITHLLLELFHEHPVPDPKLLVRVNHETSLQVWRECIDCILTGCGSPLLMNEEMIMAGMKKFGYEDEDVWNFGTSACWEPLIIGKSFDQNNRIKNIPIIDAVLQTLRDREYSSYVDFEEAVFKKLREIIRNWPLDVSFDKSPLMTLLFDDCIKTGKDFCCGGAKYNYHGLLAVGLPNLINSLLNIRDYIFEKNILSQNELLTVMESNYTERRDIYQLFVNNKNKFGLDHEDIISLTNRVTAVIDEEVEKLRILGTKAKIGFSSPGYISLAEDCPASPDGRKAGEPFAVHISPITSEIDISGIFRFASKMEYSGTRINGNVVDFIVPPSYANEPEKLAGIIKAGMENGIYELQMNVLDKDTLIDAKLHPEKYPNLIVRVWGFSAYFNDLPEEYKDNLIARADKYGAS